MVINDINADNVRVTANEVRNCGVEALEAVADVSDFRAVEGMVRETVEKFSRLDILVNNAGIISTALIEEVSVEEWDSVMGVNLKGVFYTCKACLDIMLRQQWGRIC